MSLSIKLATRKLKIVSYEKLKTKERGHEYLKMLLSNGWRYRVYLEVGLTRDLLEIALQCNKLEEILSSPKSIESLAEEAIAELPELTFDIGLQDNGSGRLFKAAELVYEKLQEINDKKWKGEA
jgi:hypothetical protein